MFFNSDPLIDSDEAVGISVVSDKILSRLCEEATVPLYHYQRATSNKISLKNKKVWN
jgi:hypothetical protein